MKLPAHCKTQLEKRELEGNTRSLKVLNAETDFSSNDYLGFSKGGDIAARVKQHPLIINDPVRFGSTGSRLLSGNSTAIIELEKKIAAFHGFESALILSSGFSANSGLLKSIASKNDTIIYDSLSHASIVDGAKESNAKHTWSFAHNDVTDLEAKIKNAQQLAPETQIFVVTESVFSMDGDFAPLTEIAEACQTYGAYLIVDEAHALGLFGKNGNGRVYELGLEDKVFAVIVTFGKALGSHGAAILGSEELKLFLINFCRSVVYSTAPDYFLLAAIDSGYDLLAGRAKDVAGLFFLIHEFRGTAKKFPQIKILDSMSAIQGIIRPGNDLCKQTSERLLQKGIDARAVLSPTVPKGTERLRICLHTYNEPPEIQALFYEISKM